MRSSHSFVGCAHRAALALTTVLVAACADAPAPLAPPAPRAARVAGAGPTPGTLPLAGGRWTGERTLVVGGTTLHARLAQPQRAEHAGGAPAVVFLSGLDAELTDWAAVQPAVAGLGARAFAYDRAGVGRSGAHTGARPSSVVADELHAALAAAGLRAPYVLVAHSVAGFHARVFAHRFPRDVAGLVLVDASIEDDFARLDPGLDEIIAGSARFPGAAAEVRARPQTLDEVFAARLPDVPLAVITNLHPEDGETPAVKAEDYRQRDAWVRQVATSVHLTTTAGHQVPLAAPDEVVGAVRWVLERARRGR
jgi:pimeloyl-ACP methyl ester carboxylesterase